MSQYGHSQKALFAAAAWTLHSGSKQEHTALDNGKPGATRCTQSCGARRTSQPGYRRSLFNDAFPEACDPQVQQ
ncbi:MAG: hypothetical protein JWN04_3877 [Myxococcaceae bacterium]|nr:hypothetical protein [Myxococcaceae bacterium]